MKNRKGISWLIPVILAFAMTMVFFIFSVLLVFEVGQQYLIAPIADEGRNLLANETGLPDSQGIDTINQLETDLSNFTLPYDLFFLLGFLAVFGSTVLSSWKAKKEGVFSTFGYLFLGSMILLLGLTFINEFNTWFIANLIIPLFPGTSISTPLIDFFIGNIAIISFIWWIILVIVNFMDKSFVSRSGGVEE